MMPFQQIGRALQPGDVLVVIHDFDARSGDELTLRRSERIELIELDDGFGDGWFLGKHLSRGGTGLFPGVYTTKAPPTKITTHTRTASSPVHQSATVTQHIPKLSTSSSTHLSQSPPFSSQTDGSSHAHPISTFSNANEAPRSTIPSPPFTDVVHRSIGEALREENATDSPVMNETLNVIDEHITDMGATHSRGANRLKDDSGSEYSLERGSFVAGPETDEEDNAQYDEETVRTWNYQTVAQHLQQLGVEPKHCDIFREQEISGDVLLDMDQNFIYMKDFDFGVMGRRLKTWHKIRDFQNQVKFGKISKQMTDRDQNSSLEDMTRSSTHGLSAQSSFARLQERGLVYRQTDTPPISEEQGDMPQPLHPQPNLKRQSWAASQTPPNAWRSTLGTESPGKVNQSQNDDSRRHSLIDFGNQPNLEFSSLSPSHQKQASLDKTWSLAGSTLATSTPTSSIRPMPKAEQSPIVQHEKEPVDIDRGYFSGNEVENRKLRNRLSKQGTSRATHNRQTSLNEQPNRTSVLKSHNRLSSVGSINEDAENGSSLASKAYHSHQKKGRFRSASERMTPTQSSSGFSPTVTNLEDGSTSMGSPAVEKMRMQDRAKKLMGFRVTSEAITNEEKSNVIKLTPSTDTAISSKPEVASPTTGSTSPSATPSLELENPDEGATTPALSKSAARPRPRNKQRTSAYTHGLLKIPPSEARKHCDYHGWMKKKASGIMTTWKPRLFILRGRRLSYYYSENDTEERGVIDISGHKVLVANNDPLTTIHASVTGAVSKSSPTPGYGGVASPAKGGTAGSVFYFKLVPPRGGMSRAVQFTKPAVHYFQVDTIAEGRKWMGEIMKSTIEHDLTSLETTNKQKTISLAKARARRERPPALGDTKVEEQEISSRNPARQSGLNIQGLEYDGTASMPAKTSTSADTSSRPINESNKENLPATARTSSASGIGA